MRAALVAGLVVAVVIADNGCTTTDSRPPDGPAAVIFEDGFEGASMVDAPLPAGLAWQDRTSGATARLDPAAHSGASSLRLVQPIPDSGASVFYTVPDSLWRGAATVQVRGWLRAHDVQNGWAGLWIRADGADRVAADSLPPARRPRALASDLMEGRGPSGTTDWMEYEAHIPLPAGTRRLVFGVLVIGTGTVWADDLALYARRTSAPPSAAALAYARAALDSMRAHAYHGETVPWDSLRNALPAALTGAKDPRDTYDVLGQMARRVNRHSDFITPELMASVGGQRGDSGRLPALRPPRHLMLSGRIGYLEVTGYVGMEATRETRYADALQSAIGALSRAGACAWVVDLRTNGGGNMYPMIAGIGPLLGGGRLGAFVAAEGQQGSWRYERGAAIAVDSGGDTVLARASHPVTLANPDAPVAVLIGAATASSGEVVAISFRGRPATRFFGEPTAGLTTGNVPVMLSDGAAINLTVSAEADRTGQSYDSSLQPDRTVAAASAGVPTERDPAVLAAAAWARAQPACTRN